MPAASSPEGVGQSRTRLKICVQNRSDLAASFERWDFLYLSTLCIWGRLVSTMRSILLGIISHPAILRRPKRAKHQLQVEMGRDQIQQIFIRGICVRVCSADPNSKAWEIFEDTINKSSAVDWNPSPSPPPSPGKKGGGRMIAMINIHNH